MSQITIKAGRAYLVTGPEREAAIGDLRDMLGHGGINVEMEITHYVPGRRGLPPPGTPEDIAIYIGGGVGSGLIAAITADIYNKVKRWALRQFESKRIKARDAGRDENSAKGERFVIYGPDGRILKTWTVDKDGEHETDGG